MNLQYAEPYNIKGNCLASLKEYESAIDSYDMAIRAKNTYASPYWNKALVLNLQRKPEESGRWLLLAIELNPELESLSRQDSYHFEK